MKKLLFISFFTITVCSCDKHHYIGMDYRIFRETIAEELAKAVIDEDIDDIRRIVIEDGVPIDFQDTEYGNTVLMIAVMNRKTKSVETLLQLGADPNLCDGHQGENSITLACRFTKSSDILELLLNFGGDASKVCYGGYYANGKMCKTSTYPLLEAVRSGNIEMVKILVAAGANVNGEEKDSYPLSLEVSIYLDHLDITLYLLENGANYDCDFISVEGEHLNIMDLLRTSMVDLDSEEYKYKRKVIDFLETRGLNYNDTPIPDYIIKRAQNRYSFTWESYLEKY